MQKSCRKEGLLQCSGHVCFKAPEEFTESALLKPQKNHCNTLNDASGGYHSLSTVCNTSIIFTEGNLTLW